MTVTVNSDGSHRPLEACDSESKSDSDLNVQVHRDWQDRSPYSLGSGLLVLRVRLSSGTCRKFLPVIYLAYECHMTSQFIYLSYIKYMTRYIWRRCRQERSRRRQESRQARLNSTRTVLQPPPLPPSWAAVRARLHAGGRALSVSGPVRRTPSPGCPMAPPHCVLNNKHPCNPLAKPVCRSISSAFLPRAAGGRIQKAVSYVCHISGQCTVPKPVICQVYSWYISDDIPDIYQTYTRHMKIGVI